MCVAWCDTGAAVVAVVIGLRSKVNQRGVVRNTLENPKTRLRNGNRALIGSRCCPEALCRQVTLACGACGKAWLFGL